MSPVNRAQRVRSVLFLFLAFPLVLYVLTMLLFWADTPIGIFHIPLAITLCAALTLYLNDWSHWKITGGGAVALVAYLAVLILLQYFFYDISWDGRQYHGTAIEQMTMGWNPVYERLVSDVWTSYEWKVWINTMPKFPWVIGACVYKITDVINTVKIITPYYAVVIFFWLCWRLYKPVSSKAIAAVVAGAVVGNPVMLSQMFTNYIDGLGYFLFLIFAVCGFLVANGQGGRMEACLLLLSFIGIAATKLSILIPTLVFLACLLCVLRVRTVIFNKKIFIGFAAIAFLALYTPHLKNLLYYGTPIYPFSSSPIVGVKAEYPANIAPKAGLSYIFKNNLPKFTSTSTPALFVESIFSQVNNTLDKTRLKLPFTFEKSEWEQFTMADVRSAGFGPLFSGAFVVSLLLLVWGLLRQRSKMLYVCFGAGALALLLAAITQGSWWARYVSYIWCVPIVFVLPFIFSSASRILRYGAYFVIGVLFISSLVVAKYNFIYQAKHSLDLSRYYKAIHERGDIIKEACIMNLDEIYHREKNIPFYCATIEYEQIVASTCINKDLYHRKEYPFAKTGPHYKELDDYRIFGVHAEVKENISEEDKKKLATCFAVPYKLPVERISPIKLLAQYGQTIWKHF